MLNALLPDSPATVPLESAVEARDAFLTASARALAEIDEAFPGAEDDFWGEADTDAQDTDDDESTEVQEDLPKSAARLRRECKDVLSAAVPVLQVLEARLIWAVASYPYIASHVCLTPFHSHVDVRRTTGCAKGTG